MTVDSLPTARPAAALSSSRAAGAPAESFNWPLLLLVFVLMAAGLVAKAWLNAGKIPLLNDTDDAMRMVQVRDLLAGQGWYDMTQWRLDAPGGVFMHWSRIIDIPLVLLLKFFGFFLAPEQAERATRIAFPVRCFVGLLVAVPLAATIGVLARFALRQYLESSFYTGTAD